MKGASLTGGGFGQMKLRGNGVRKRKAAQRAGPRPKELSNGRRARAERANTTGEVRARETSSMDGLDESTTASSNEPGRR